MAAKGLTRYWVLALLTLVYAFNFVDRQIVVVLQGQIAKDLNLDDQQLGLITGLAFAVLYTTAGIPIAMLADRMSRTRIIAAAVTVWSFFTVVTGYATSFVQMLLARVGVGLGEAGALPPSYSLLADIFEGRSRAMAFAIFGAGLYLGIIMGYIGGSLLAAEYGWRITIIIAGAPGIILGLLVWFTIPEPPRVAPLAARSGLRETLEHMWSLKSFRWLVLAAAFRNFVGYGTGNFMPLFLQRTHGFSLQETGILLAGVQGLAGALGLVVGGMVAMRLLKNDPLGGIKTSFWSGMLAIPIGMVMQLSQDTTLLAVAYFFATALFSCFFTLTVNDCMALAREGEKATVTAIFMLIGNLVGLGLGPSFTGTLSVMLEPQFGGDALRYAMLVCHMMFIPSCFFYYLAMRSYRGDLERSK